MKALREGTNWLLAVVLVFAGVNAVLAEGGQEWQDGLNVFGTDFTADPHITAFVFAGMSGFPPHGLPNEVSFRIFQGGSLVLWCFGETSYDPVEVDPGTSLGVLVVDTDDLFCGVNSLGSVVVTIACSADGVERRHVIETESTGTATLQRQYWAKSASCTLEAGSLLAEFTEPCPFSNCSVVARMFRSHEVTIPD